MTEETNYGFLEEKYSDFDSSEIVIVPVCYDETSTWIKGADKGPEAIIEASGNMELYDIETDSEVYKKGIFTDTPIENAESPADMIERVRGRVEDFIGAGKFTVVVGGEHSVSIGAIKAHVQSYADTTVVQLDAHADLQETYNGSKYNHACVMARVKEMCPFVQVGTRSMDISEKAGMDSGRVVWASDVGTDKKWIKKLISNLSKNVYITIDVDVFDPSIMPSTGTPEPGGLLWYDVLELLRNICAARNVTGFDVVELCPNSNDRAPDFLVAKLIYKFLSYKFCDTKR